MSESSSHGHGQTHWLGLTHGSGRWEISPSSSAENDLGIARAQLAGGIAEAVLDPSDFRLGSSLDEAVLAQMIVAGAADKIRASFEEVMAAQFAGVLDILMLNKPALTRLTEALHDCCRLRGARLGRLLTDVVAPHWLRGSETIQRRVSPLDEMLRQNATSLRAQLTGINSL